MQHYSSERKEAALKKMGPPNNIFITKLSLDMGISQATLYHWRRQGKDKGQVLPGNGKNAEQWSSANKFAAVLKTATLNEADLALYCRKKGLFVE
jgi:transposase-like protein